MQIRPSVALHCALLLVLACGGDGGKSGGRDDDDAGSQNDASEEQDAAEELDAAQDDADASVEPDAATDNKGRLRGRVTYADGTAVGQLDVRIQGKVYRSDSRGVFAADDLADGEHELSVHDPRVSAAQLKVSVSKDRLTQASLAVLPIKKLPVRNLVAGGETLEPTDNIKLRLPPSALRVKSSQAPATGDAEAHYALVKSASDLKAAPGRLRGKIQERLVDLESFGMIDLRFAQGQEDLELTVEAELDLPLGPNTFVDQQEVDSFSFDDQTGLWKVEGRAVIDKSAGGNGVAKIRAGHFSWWTIAAPVEQQTCLSGRLLSDGVQPLAHAWVDAVGSSYWGTFGAETAEDGSFCLSVKTGSQSTLSAFGINQSSYFEWKQTLVASSAPAMCGDASCQALGDISGTSLFDECQGNVTSNQNHLLLLSSGDPALDASLQAGLMQHGHAVTLGPPYHMFTADIDLTPYDAIYLQANYNWSGLDMPLPGQRRLINWVNCGGGLVTVEWTTWKIGQGTFQLIDAIFPAARTTAYTSVAMETYVKVTDDATLNAGLPDMFTFNTTNYSGTQSALTPRPGAVVYYDAQTYESGLLGWGYNLGRVATFSTTVGTNEVADANFMRLIANTADWVQRD